MNMFLRSLLIASVLAVSLIAIAPQPAQAQDYWSNHWNWYDNTYRPYYYRSYYSNPGYANQGYAYGPSAYNYGPAYTNQGYYNQGYTNYGTPYRNYTGTSNLGYGRTYGGGQAVNVGGFSFGWR
jgi:hypothetical protein